MLNPHNRWLHKVYNILVRAYGNRERFDNCFLRLFEIVDEQLWKMKCDIRWLKEGKEWIIKIINVQNNNFWKDNEKRIDKRVSELLVNTEPNKILSLENQYGFMKEELIRLNNIIYAQQKEIKANEIKTDTLFDIYDRTICDFADELVEFKERVIKLEKELKKMGKVSTYKKAKQEKGFEKPKGKLAASPEKKIKAKADKVLGKTKAKTVAAKYKKKV